MYLPVLSYGNRELEGPSRGGLVSVRKVVLGNHQCGDGDQQPILFTSWCSCSEPYLDLGNKFRDLLVFFPVFKAKSAEIQAFRPKCDPVNVPVRRLESTG